MYISKSKITLFSQLTSFLERKGFKKLVDEHESDKNYSDKASNKSWNHLIAMIFYQLAGCSGLRDVDKGLGSVCSDIEHLGMSKAMPHSSLSYINWARNWELFRDYYFYLLSLYSSELGIHKKRLGITLSRKIFIADSTMVSLCLDVFDWAKYRTTKGAIKLHTVLSMDLCLPVFCDVTEGAVSDHHLANVFELPKGSVIAADRGYFNAAWLKELDSREAFFVIRMKSSILTEVTDEYDITDQKAENLLSDEDILFLGQQTSHAYASELRCVKFLDYDDKEVIVVTNNFQWSASTVQDLYKNRWAIETFFREVKQNLSIKSFCGTSYNAVMIQVWTTMIAMLMIKYLKKRATYKWSTANLVHQLRIHLLVKIDLQKWIDEPLRRMHRPPPNIQLEISF